MGSVNKHGPLNQEFEKLVKKTLELWHVPGVAVAVVDVDQTWAKVLSFPIFPLTHSTVTKSPRATASQPSPPSP